MKTEDEFKRPPRWLLVFWSQNKRDIEKVVLLDPFEANIAFRELRFPGADGASLHLFSPRNRRDQKELLTSGLTSWCGIHKTVRKESLNSQLDFVVMAVSVFGSSTCFNKNEPDGHSTDKICRFLGLIPPPSLAEAGITSDDWRALINLKLIDTDGFIPDERPRYVTRPSSVSNSCWQIFQSVSSNHCWRQSPLNAIFALVQIRNMEPWYDRSDLNAVLRKQITPP